VDRDSLSEWVERYRRAWRSPGTDALRGLFHPEATYRTAPFEEPYRGLEAIAALWEAERESPDERFEMRAEVVSVEGDTGVVRVGVSYAGPPPREFRDLWVVALDCGGLCTAFEEWPFEPGHRGWFAAGPDPRA
jgi:hypothetical protein